MARTSTAPANLTALLPPAQWLEARDVRPLHARQRFDSRRLFAIDELDGLLARAASLYDDVRSPMKNQHDVSLMKVVMRNGEPWTGKLGKVNETVPLATLKQGFNKGFTLLLNGLQARVPSIDALCQEVESFTRGRTNANLYLTPNSAQGFETHYDWFDGIVLQLSGSKTWRLWAPLEASRLPTTDMKAKPSAATLAALPAPSTIRLGEGDVLYVPRGFPHEALTPADATQSMHVTIGLLGGSRLTYEVLLHATLRRDFAEGSGVRLMHAAIRAAAASPQAEAVRRSLPLPPLSTLHGDEASGAAALQCEEAETRPEDSLRMSDEEVASVHRSLLVALSPLDAELAGATSEQLASLACEWAATARAALSLSRAPSDHHILSAEACTPFGRRRSARNSPPDWSDVRDAALGDVRAALGVALREEASLLAAARVVRKRHLVWHATAN